MTGSAVEAILGKDARTKERLHKAKDAFVFDPISHATHERRMVDLVETRRDISLEHPLAVPVG